MPINFFAYIDPGSGLLVSQMIAAAFVGSLFYVKKTRDLIARFGRKIFRLD